MQDSRRLEQVISALLFISALLEHARDLDRDAEELIDQGNWQKTFGESYPH